MYYIIPALYHNHKGEISNCNIFEHDFSTDYDQFALLDLIEFIGKNSRDVEKFYPFSLHPVQYKLKLFETNNVKEEFRKKINEIFRNQIVI